MRKILYITSALGVILTSCTKTVVEEPLKEIFFQWADHSVVTKADPEDYKDRYKDIPFGTYAWYKAVNPVDNSNFMENQKVSYVEPSNRWTTTGITYYWPKTGTLDFISYSPYTEDGIDAPAPVITQSGISYPVWDVNAHQNVDVMYSDKVTGLTGNVNTYNHGYEGVPTLFHHALAKVGFKVRALYLSATSETGDVTRWEVTINSITLNDILTSGKLSMTLGEDGTWVKPETNAWDPSDALTNISIEGAEGELTEEQQILGEPFIVLPQVLNKQSVTINATIKTYHTSTGSSEERLLYTEPNLNVTGLLKSPALDTWGINQCVYYDLVFSPSLTNGGIDPFIDGPISITFDPAVADWDNVTVTQIIQL